MNYVTEPLIVRDAQIIFRNFAGEEKPNNRAGLRNFCVIIEDPLVAQQLSEDLWNVKILAPRDDDTDIRHFIPVAVNFDNFPPDIYLVTNRVKTKLDEESVGELDGLRFKKLDLTISPYNWEVNGKIGVKAYLKTMYATIQEDEFASEYRDIPESH